MIHLAIERHTVNGQELLKQAMEAGRAALQEAQCADAYHRRQGFLPRCSGDLPIEPQLMLSTKFPPLWIHYQARR